MDVEAPATRRLNGLWAYLDSTVATVPFRALVEARQRIHQPEAVLGGCGTQLDPGAVDEVRREAIYLEQKLRQLFAEQNGRIVNEYYCPYAFGGAALTELDVQRARAEESPVRQLHSVLNTTEDRLLKLQCRCALLFENAVTVFGEGGGDHSVTQLRRATDSIFAANAAILLAADLAEDPNPKGSVVAAIGAAQLQVQVTEDRVNVVIQRQARFGYFAGVLIGGALATVLCVAFGLVASRYWSTIINPAAVVASTVFGVLGGMTSVFQRMSNGRLVLDYTASRGQRMLLGAFRPLIGATFAAVVQFALVSGLLTGQAAASGDAAPTFGFFAVIGFVAGFSERFATDMIERAGRLLSATGDPAVPTGPGAGPTEHPNQIETTTPSR